MKRVAITPAKIKKLLANKNTKILVNWVEQSIQFSDQLLSTQFFHPTHNEEERSIICHLLEETFKENKTPIKISRLNRDAVSIKKI